MRKLVYIPLDGTRTLLKTGFSIEQIEQEYNPQKYFDEVYVISTKDRVDDYGTLKFIKSDVAHIASFISKINPIAVRANGGFFCCDISLACRVKAIPVMVSVHDDMYDNIRQSLVFADKVVCISEAVKKAVKLLTDVKDENIMMLPRFVDNSIFQKKYDFSFFKKLNNKYGSGKHIIHVGRKTNQKNIETVIESLVYLPKDYKLIQIGLGDESQYLDLAEKKGVIDRVFFIGGIPREELALYYSWADCMCTPSRWEGFGLVFIEACACECPVITSNIVPMNEYLKDNESAMLLDDFENGKKVAEVIFKVCTDKVLADRLRNEGKKVAYRYDITNAGRREIENYNEMIKDLNCNSANNLKVEFEKLNLPYVIYGAGNNGKTFYKKMHELGKEPICFVDRDSCKNLKNINKIKIINYDELCAMEKNFIVVVTPCIRNNIICKLKKDGFSIMEMEWYENLIDNAQLIDNQFYSKWL